MWHISATVVVIFLASGAVSQCPGGWLNHGNMCYHFSHDRENWIDAQDICEHFGGYLAEIHTAFEDNFLMQEAIRVNKHYWVGASDLMVENEWRWLHSGTVVSYNHWGSNEPNNNGGNENCLEIRGAPYNNWNDGDCIFEQTYICQKERDAGTEIVG